MKFLHLEMKESQRLTLDLLGILAIHTNAGETDQDSFEEDNVVKLICSWGSVSGNYNKR